MDSHRHFEKLESNAKAKHSPTLICPEIIGTESCIFPSYPICNKHTVISPGETKVTCNNSNKWLLVKKLSTGFTSAITVERDDDNVTLKLFTDVLNEYFKKKGIVKEFFENPAEREDGLIKLDGIVDITCSLSRKVVTKIVV